MTLLRLPVSNSLPPSSLLITEFGIFTCWFYTLCDYITIAWTMMLRIT